MQVEQAQLAADGWSTAPAGLRGDANLVLLFGSTEMLSQPGALEQVRAAYPNALTFGCSTAGEIAGTDVCDGSLVVTAIRFNDTLVRGGRADIANAGDSFRVGKQLATSLDPEGLVHVLVLSDGLNVNGSELVRGLEAALPRGVTVTGGLAGDGGRFVETLVVWDGIAATRSVAVVGLYGDRLHVACGSKGGWDPFGPERVVTRSSGNVVYELDGRSALDLYKTYLGRHAAGLPATGLLFPLSLRRADYDERVVRTILGVDEAAQSVIFAGDVPEGAQVRLMSANFDRLVDGAIAAAATCRDAVEHSEPDLALLISCVGRKMVLQQRIEEEVEGVGEVLGGPALTGFYSYGEISPFTPGARCELHNQTMTVTTLREAA